MVVCVCRGNVIQLCVHGPERVLHTTVLTWMATVPSAFSCNQHLQSRSVVFSAVGRFSYSKTVLQVEIRIKLSLELLGSRRKATEMIHMGIFTDRL